MNGNGDILFMLCLVVAMFAWYIFKIFQMQIEDERRTADRCGYSRKRLLIEYYQDYFSKVLKKARPTVKECLEYDEFLSLWLISKDYDVAQSSQCILEKDYDSLHNLIENFMEKKEEHTVKDNSLLNEMRKHYNSVRYLNVTSL